MELEYLERHGVLYERATRHPYILSIRDGTVDFACYKKWLGQDYLFVKAFVRFVASILVKYPFSLSDDDNLLTLLGGLAALHDELQWFQKQAQIWKIELQSLKPEAATQAYCRFLEKMSEPDVEYPVALAAFWAVEAVYCDSFALCLEPNAGTPAELLEACQRWGSPEFQSYCQTLKLMAASALKQESAKRAAEDAFVEVLNLEIGFWNMSTN